MMTIMIDGKEYKVVEEFHLENAWWSASRMRMFCIENDLYTAGNNRQYSMMLDFVATHKPTKENIKLVATDIVAHSIDPDGNAYSIYRQSPYQDDVSDIANAILEDVVVRPSLTEWDA